MSPEDQLWDILIKFIEYLFYMSYTGFKVCNKVLVDK